MKHWNLWNRARSGGRACVERPTSNPAVAGQASNSSRSAGRPTSNGELRAESRVRNQKSKSRGTLQRGPSRVILYCLLFTVHWSLLRLPATAQEVKPPKKKPEFTEAQKLAMMQAVRGYQRDLAYRMEDLMIAGYDVDPALTLYMKGRALKFDEPIKQAQYYLKGMDALRKPMKPLPKAKWPANPKNIKLTFKETLKLPETLYTMTGLEVVNGVTSRIVEFKVDGLKEYGVIAAPATKGKYPLIVFTHGAAYGVPDYMLPWMERLAKSGYVVAAPAFRGEDLLLDNFAVITDIPKYKCEGKIENYKGEPNDVLAIADGALKLPNVKGPKYALVGHSFGSGAGLLAAARTDKVSCIVSYDAWLVNPFRYYWECMTGDATGVDKSYLWGSWEEYLEAAPVKDQLKGLMERSIVHNAERLKAPLLMFLGGAYNGSAYHYAHKDFVKQLRKYKKKFRLEIIPGGGHNFVLYFDRQPAKVAYKMQMAWLKRYHPPVSVGKGEK